MFKNKADKYRIIFIGWLHIHEKVLDFQYGFLVHLPSGVFAVGGSLVKSC